ncbi:HSP20-like chaperone [Didymella exigua CBS 183.55]|uniref:HSP20-like chaperone n=1 Tax=Didymella exigua CBS 183.55 TaxID=1150837 RepID=A0A6A5RD26_9PLEO|nr:HSP20-like chaperone [Didymella exigua CBS 183.55]KAF1926155.1 HSP20-like chaperone [Didymella exigua CBS 183.55]
MAYILAPRFAQAYQATECNNPFGFCASAPRPTHDYRIARRSQPQPCPSPFASFLSQIKDLANQIDRESQRQAQIKAQREAKREAQQARLQQQLRKRALRAQFAVTQGEQGWQVEAEVPDFQQENISIEVNDENTLKIAGNTEWGAKLQIEVQPETEGPLAVEQSPEDATEQTIEESADEKLEDGTLEPSVQVATETTGTGSARPATPDSDTSSHKSYQPTVEDDFEDDFEDLGPEASTLFSTPFTLARTSEPKGKEKNVEPTVIAEDPEVSVPKQQQQKKEEEVEERPRGSFERTFRFPERINADGVRASFKNGVLCVTVPRAQAQHARRIAIL